jgi:hypothetical protein
LIFGRNRVPPLVYLFSTMTVALGTTFSASRIRRTMAGCRLESDYQLIATRKFYRSTPGVDIVLERREAREEQKAVEIKAVLPTFEECAEAYIRQHWTTWSEKHRDQWPSSLKRYAHPTIGKLTIPPRAGTAATRGCRDQGTARRE